MTSLVQYVVVRGDLYHKMKWPIGAMIAQACHACTSIICLYKDDPNVLEYTADLDNMRKVVLEAKDEENLCSLAEALQQNDVDSKLWIEQPENIATCLVTKPYKKEDVQRFFKNLKLFK
ncbi:putative peptidyl-tRNA hydrolase PTRHD1 [Ciona intestinalis]|uniref:peptidyl-tRNA hydrolase n=1 Tax=Ciona intestinalis TaxID=7719 RepID=H2XQM2_CIOIN|nr:putative peptidyl-tRNA hydrolase PTRHD1 [Ciona intestinalis]|eukprot:XP_002127563.1 putative peptidyl-tRNA hydrolase PTRHD1 [Ciona intestinalis]